MLAYTDLDGKIACLKAGCPGVGPFMGADAELDPLPGVACCATTLTMAGSSLAAHGDQVVAGAPALKTTGRVTGGAFVFEKPAGGWTGGPSTTALDANGKCCAVVGGVGPIARLTPSDSAAVQAGWGVGFFEDAITVAAPSAQVGSNAEQGAVYAYREPAGGWADATEDFRFASSTGGAGDRLGLLPPRTLPGEGPMAILGADAFVGSPTNAKPVSVFSLKHQLSVEKAGAGSGSVTRTGIDCPTRCSRAFWRDTTVTLAAAADPGSVFTGWDGGGCSGTGPCEVEMTGPQTVRATFAEAPPGSATLIVRTAGDGSVAGDGFACPGTCSKSVPAGTRVTVSATPAAGWAFEGWNGGGCGTAPTCAVTVGFDKTVTATFVRRPDAELSVALSGLGDGSVTGDGLDCPASSCARSYASASTVTLRAVAAAGSQFAGWSGACSGTDSCTVTLGGDTAVTATFARLAPGATPTAPDTRITKARIRRRRASFTFRATGAASGFRCAVVRRARRGSPPLRACASPRSFSKLKPGRYRFVVAASGAAGTDPTPATRTFRIGR